MNKIKIALGAFLILFLFFGIYSYNGYQDDFNLKLKTTRNYARNKGIQIKNHQSYTSYTTNLEILGQMFPIEIYEEPWVIFSNNFKISNINAFYYDSNEKVIWIEQIFPGQGERIYFYKHNEPSNFINWLKNIQKEGEKTVES